jgi:hypothetical protein
MRGAFPTQRIFSLNQAHLYSKANVHLKTLVKRVAASGALPEPSRSFRTLRVCTKLPSFIRDCSTA